MNERNRKKTNTSKTKKAWKGTSFLCFEIDYGLPLQNSWLSTLIINAGL